MYKVFTHKRIQKQTYGLQALCPLLHCLESSLISDGIRSDTSVLLSLLLSAPFFGRDLVFSLLVVLIFQTDVALFLYFSKKKKILLMLLFPSCHRWNIYIKRKCHVIFLSSSFLFSFLHSHVSPHRGCREILYLMVFRVGGFPSGLCPLAG